LRSSRSRRSTDACSSGGKIFGPKAGGPHYLYRFCAEQTVTVNTAAAGGNASLIAMGE